MFVVAPCLYPNEEPAQLMVDSARRHGIGVTLYGIGQPFIPHGADAQVAKLYDAISHLPDDDLLLVTDCRDVLFLTGIDEIVEKFRRCRLPLLLMSAEKECWPPDDEVFNGLWKTSPHGYDFINAGQYIGCISHIRYCLKYLLGHYRFKHPGMDNSQPWWPLALLQKELYFEIDSECQIFQTMSGGGSHHIVVEGNRLRNTATGSLPCLVHYNGCCGNQEPYQEMYRRLYGST